MNIQLPYQKFNNLVRGPLPAHPPPPPGPARGPVGATATSSSSRAAGKAPTEPNSPQEAGGPLYAALLPYVRRLIVTGHDSPAVLHGFFGDDWVMGIGPLHEQERRNYLFAAKSDTWLRVRASYDMGGGQVVPFLRPLREVSENEIVTAETNWSEWLAMQDWMLGPRAPGDEETAGNDAPGEEASH